jgi:hypothetical protein
MRIGMPGLPSIWRVWLPGLAALVLLSPRPCPAALGGEVSSVKKDQARLKATLRVAPADRYALHEMKASTGTSVREYADPSGRVFAVTWEGPWRPDLRQLLGPYYADFEKAAQSKRTGHNGPLVSSTTRLVIEMSGRPRAFYGRAYVPDLLPSGVDPAEIR